MRLYSSFFRIVILLPCYTFIWLNSKTARHYYVPLNNFPCMIYIV
jgi:hypothetical protein